ncbi:MAG: hypothetical protein BRD50_08330 [Bacteroidetes bacterium SW_11_45_7]|nr:MAG: hypothetical protein BRD50_08330 [Bacteroidetes bacterium SW_11_45_7]
MQRKRISSGSRFEEEVGYSRAVVVGDWIFVSGTTGFDYNTMSISDDIVEQADQCIRNIQSALAQADASLTNIVRILHIVPDADEFPRCHPLLRQYFGAIRPTSTMISAGLADERMKIEMEVTAYKGLTDM